MSDVLICFALAEEAAAVNRSSRELLRVEILVTGMGRRNAERSLTAALERRPPRRVITSGFAGALNPDLPFGAIVFEKNQEPALVPRLTSAGFREAVFHCASRIVVTAREKAELRNSTGADVVEMESAHIGRICGQRGIPCLTLRVISDTADEDLPLDFNAMLTSRDRLHAGKLALALLRSPSKIRALLKLQRQCASAAQKLAEALPRAVQICNETMVGRT